MAGAEEPAAHDEAEEPGTPAGQGSPAPGTLVGHASPAASTSPSTTWPIQFATPPPEISDLVDDHYDDKSLRFWAMENIVGQAAPPRFAARILDDQELHLGSAEEPTTFREAERDHRWRKAMD